MNSKNFGNNFVNDIIKGERAKITRLRVVIFGNKDNGGGVDLWWKGTSL